MLTLSLDDGWISIICFRFRWAEIADLSDRKKIYYHINGEVIGAAFSKSKKKNIWKSEGKSIQSINLDFYEIEDIAVSTLGHQKDNHG